MPSRFKCTQTSHTRQNHQYFRWNTSISYVQFLNSCAPVHSGGWWPPKRHCKQKVKQCETNLSTIVNCNVLKLSLSTLSKMLFIFIMSSLFLPYPVYRSLYMIVSAQCGILGVTAVTGWTEQGKAWSSVFHVSKAVTLLAQAPTVLLSTVALPWTLQRFLWIFRNNFFSVTWNSITACCT